LIITQFLFPVNQKTFGKRGGLICRETRKYP